MVHTRPLPVIVASKFPSDPVWQLCKVSVSVSSPSVGQFILGAENFQLVLETVTKGSTTLSYHRLRELIGRIAAERTSIVVETEGDNAAGAHNTIIDLFRAMLGT